MVPHAPAPRTTDAPVSTGYLVRNGRQWLAFVPPLRGSGFVLTDWCVLVVPCESCRAKAGELCRGSNGETKQTHSVRRTQAQKMKRDPQMRDYLARACPAVAFTLDVLDQLAEERDPLDVLRDRKKEENR